MVLQPVAPISVSGRVVLEPGSNLPRGTLLRVGKTQADPDGVLGPQRVGVVNSDLSFQFETWPGLGFVSLSGVAGFVITSVRLDGVDITDRGFDAQAGQSLTGLVVEITSRPPELSGTVSSKSGVRTSAYSVGVFSQDRKRWSGASGGRHFALARVDQSGRFVVRTLPPGSCNFAVPLEQSDEDDWSDPQSLERLRGRAVPVRLEAGQTHVVMLKASS